MISSGCWATTASPSTRPSQRSTIDPEAKEIVRQFIDAGYGDTRMADIGVRYASLTKDASLTKQALRFYSRADGRLGEHQAMEWVAEGLRVPDDRRMGVEDRTGH